MVAEVATRAEGLVVGEEGETFTLVEVCSCLVVRPLPSMLPAVFPGPIKPVRLQIGENL